MKRDIKVFISSTFKDLDNERNYIVKSIFPRIVTRLNGLAISEVDLRWGITEEQANCGQVVDLCLRYLINSRPFIIGILGERYGSTFNVDNIQLSPMVKSTFPLVEEQLLSGKSITEIEILNGALNSTSEDIKAIFFVKETSSPAQGETIQQYNKLCSLKRKVREQTKYPVYTYSNLLDLDIIVDFICKNTAPKEPSSNGHYALKAISNTKHLLEKYLENEIEDSSALYHIQNLIEKGKPISVVEGDSGVGKSTLIAHLIRITQSQRKLIYFYGDSVDQPLSVRSFQKYFFCFARELLRNIDQRVYNEDRFLISAISRTKWCFVLDNIGDEENDASLLYLPVTIKLFAEWMNNQFGSEIDYKILMVKNTDVKYHSAIYDDVPVFQIRPHKYKPGRYFSPEKFIKRYMNAFSKCLTQSQIDKLMSSDGAYIPMALELACDYLRENVSYDRLNEFIELFSVIETWEDLMGMYIDILYRDCNVSDVKSIVTLLCTYRTRLSRKELHECSKVPQLSFNIILSYLDKMLNYDLDGRMGLKNKSVKKLLMLKFCISKDDIKKCAFKNHKYFFENIRDLYTQEDFVIDSGKECGRFRRCWETVIPKNLFWRYPISNFNRKMLLGDITHFYNLLEMCGGQSYENAIKAFESYRYDIAMAATQSMLVHTKWGKDISEDNIKEARKIEEQLQKTRNPYIYDVLHTLESFMLINADKLVKHVLSNPPYANRILETGLFISAWKWLLSKGYDIKDPKIRDNTLFPDDGYSFVCKLLEDKEAIEFYKPKREHIYEFSDKWVHDYFTSKQFNEVKTVTYTNGKYMGYLDFFGRHHKYGYLKIEVEGVDRIYIGEFKRGKKHGKGTIYDSTGYIYEGEFRKGVADGRGVVAFPYGVLYEGDFVKGKMTGFGRYYMIDGDIYEGGIKDGYFSGKGKYFYANGSCYEAEWENDVVKEGTRVWK